MTHPNALLTPRARLRLARLIVEDGYPATIAAKMFMVSPIRGSKPEPPKIPSADQRGLSRARSMG